MTNLTSLLELVERNNTHLARLSLIIQRWCDTDNSILACIAMCIPHMGDGIYQQAFASAETHDSLKEQLVECTKDLADDVNAIYRAITDVAEKVG